MLSDPGKEFHYSNMAFDVLADVVAKVTGQTFEGYVNEYLLQPLGMNESSFYQPEIKPELRTSPHTGEPPIVSKIYPYNRRHAPSSTLNSNVLDMSHLLIADLNNGFFKGTQVLNPESHKLLMTPSFTIDKEKGYTVGLSWFLGPYKDGLQIVIHSGLDLGYSSFLTMVPEKKMGIVILSNYDQTPVETINFKILDVLLSAMDEQVSSQKEKR
jgi:CubicO group peptidase (beta-lactamase class C family)